VVSDKAIGSPIIDRPQSICVLNRPSLDKFATKVKKDGLLLINTSLIDAKCDRTDIGILEVAANEIALGEGTGKAANMAVLGAYVGWTKAVKLASLEDLVRYQFKSKPQFIDVNLRVLHRGYELGDKGTN
jgi:2-oxoglutarate ferredoxin oxidoreductase subunit gamma